MMRFGIHLSKPITAPSSASASRTDRANSSRAAALLSKGISPRKSSSRYSRSDERATDSFFEHSRILDSLDFLIEPPKIVYMIVNELSSIKYKNTLKTKGGIEIVEDA
jgi:hypothetical protein